MRALGRPASLPAPTPTPTPLPTPGPCLMSWFSCTATGAPRISASSSFIASRPTPAALRRAASISPGGLLGCGHARFGHGQRGLAQRLGLRRGRLAGRRRAACSLVATGSLAASLASSASRVGAGGGGGGRRTFDQQLRHRRRQGLRHRAVGLASPAATAARCTPAALERQHAVARCGAKRRASSGETDHGQDRRAERRTRHGSAGSASRCHHMSILRTANDTSLKSARAAVNITLRSRLVRDVLVAHDRDAPCSAPRSPCGPPRARPARSSSAFSGRRSGRRRWPARR